MIGMTNVRCFVGLGASYGAKLLATQPQWRKIDAEGGDDLTRAIVDRITMASRAVIVDDKTQRQKTGEMATNGALVEIGSRGQPSIARPYDAPPFDRGIKAGRELFEHR